MDHNQEFGNFKCFRLGKHSKDVCRPLKVTFSNPEIVIHYLSKRHILKDQFNKISMSADRTLKQREYLKQLRNEVSEKISNGHNCRIKYLNGIPKIISISKNGHTQLIPPTQH